MDGYGCVAHKHGGDAIHTARCQGTLEGVTKAAGQLGTKGPRANLTILGAPTGWKSSDPKRGAGEELADDDDDDDIDDDDGVDPPPPSHRTATGTNKRSRRTLRRLVLGTFTFSSRHQHTPTCGVRTP